ncbi:Alginate lyase [Opitutaceae bacterium TAV1]|nr:Alginate lyase [Opitutaceae bacterium TAV1]
MKILCIRFRLFRIFALLLVSGAFTCQAIDGRSQTAQAAPPPPVLIQIRYPDLLANRAEADSGDAPLKKAVASLAAKADKLLDQPAFTVTDPEKIVAPSGDPHDFHSIGKYAWPNPDTADGMPWVRRDGYTNPDCWTGKYDLTRYGRMRGHVTTLGLAWFYTRDEKYAAKAAEFLRTWFIAPETRMNPNFNYASAQPGVHDGMAIGIIEGADLIRMLDSVKLLGLSRSWTPADDAALKDWFRAYTTWLLESPPGKAEAAMVNNHGAWHAAQVAAFSLYAGDADRVAGALKMARHFVDTQIAADGSLPHELNRNRSLWYTLYGLRALTTLAGCASAAGDDLWAWRNPKTPEAPSLKIAFEALIPFLTDKAAWPRKHLDKQQAVQVAALPLFYQAAAAFRAPGLIEATRYLAQKTGDRASLLARLPDPVAAATTTVSPAPVILVRSGWQTVNIGDIAHTPGLLTLLRKHIPEARLILWPADIRDDVEPLLRRQFPDVEIVRGGLDSAGFPDTPAVRSAFDRAGLFICSSAPDIHVATKVFDAWRKYHAADIGHHPYGFYGVTVDRESAFARFVGARPLSPSERDLLDHAAFVYTRETTSLDYLRRENVKTPILAFAPDAVFGVDQYDTARANAWLRANALEKDRYICVIGRTRFAPYYKIRKHAPTENDRAREAYNEQHIENDLGKIRDAITRFVEQTGLKVVLCPEMTFEVEVAKTGIYDKLPERIRSRVVWKDSYWMPDEAAAVYRDAVALLSMECHSPIIAAAAGTPSLYLPTATETSKGQMWPDIGLGDWMLNLDRPDVTGETLSTELVGMHKNETEARAKLSAAMARVRGIQRETMAQIRALLPHQSLSN